jgi:hypothetical protein
MRMVPVDVIPGILAELDVTPICASDKKYHTQRR